LNRKNLIYDLFNLENKTVILTGSSGRLGSQYAHILSASGANVILVDKEIKKNKKLEQELIKKYNTKAVAYTTDISIKKDVIKMKNSVLKKFKKIDVLINNAFYAGLTDGNKSKYSAVSLENFPLELWNQVINVNLTGVFLCSQEIGTIMAKQKNGVIVNIASIYGLVGADQRIYGKSKLNSPISYAATKGAIVNLTRYLAAYWQKKNVRVNTLSLGGMLDKSYMDKTFIKNYSEKTILGRMANNNEYNAAILFLSSNASSYMTGSNLILDGGWTAW
jgi:NAD(P)-dependent dehydrogenase (short-subunit alcohol dehydrogenase family)